MRTRKIELALVEVPNFGLPGSQPEVGRVEYGSRIEMARAMARQAQLDFLLVYGDREHLGNIAYLTGFDPRFEEALLVIPSNGGKPALILGNEGLGYSEICTVDVDRKLYQGFSLLGQKRGDSPRLEPVLRACNIKEGSRVGVAGWKYASREETDDPEHWLDAPAFIVDALRGLTGQHQLVVNATGIFMNPVDGLRITNSVDQLAAFEFGAAHCSQAVRNAIENLRPGMTELEAVTAMRLNGLPQSVYVMFSSGPRARLGMPSPMQRAIEQGDPFFAALGYRGGLTARGGFVVQDAGELRRESADYLDYLVKPYFGAVVAWYECVGIGTSGAELQTTVDDALAGSGIELALNPGHLIHIEEWLHSPVYPSSPLRLASGMLIQCDIIPVVEARYHTTNAEDTLALADASLRDELALKYPEAWQRIQARRAFMESVLGIRLKPEVLPFSNLPAVLQPFGLSPQRVMVARG